MIDSCGHWTARLFLHSCVTFSQHITVYNINFSENDKHSHVTKETLKLKLLIAFVNHLIQVNKEHLTCICLKKISTLLNTI